MKQKKKSFLSLNWLLEERKKREFEETDVATRKEPFVFIIIVIFFINKKKNQRIIFLFIAWLSSGIFPLA